MNTRLRALALPTLITLALLLLLLGGNALGQSLRYGTANRNANLRSGPGTTFALAGSVKAGQPLTFTKALTDWFQLDTGPWIAAFLVEIKPISGTVQPTPTSAATKPAQTPTPAKAAPTAAPKATNTPGPVATPTKAFTYICSHDAYKCSDFDSHADAQGAFDYCVAQGAGDIHRLDQDGNGVACESLR